ncbi:MAG TPA: UDP-glucose 4-epimerase GalE [Arenicellales bacterium]|nr:UDP-glucose 4-epimerase GalE [Arenicellales bacterium]
MTATVLVTGGAGYIGSHTTRQLADAGFEVLVVDNLYSGHAWAIDPRAQFHQLDAGDAAGVGELLRSHAPVAAVIHFAGHIVVPESVSNPLKYYRNNPIASANLIEACRRHGVQRFLFSSSAAVYGQPEVVPIPEEAATAPINPYGRSKLVTEWTLEDVATSSQVNGDDDPFRYMALRYFNVAGASLDAALGQATPEATHLIKVACEAACGKRRGVQIFGTDYPTPDGTGIRDYIHVEDLAAAHVLGLRHLLDGGESAILNCGYGHGFSVREVVDTVRRVSGARFHVEETGRRAGDPAQLVADNARIRERLGWTPRYDDLELICRTAYEWEKALAARMSRAG